MSESMQKYLPSALKTICVLGIGWGLHTSVTPPSTPLSSTSTAEFHSQTIIERLILALQLPVKHGHPTGIAQSFAWVASGAELYLSHREHNWSVGPWTVAGFVLGAGGGLLRRRCYAVLGPRFTFNLSTHIDSKLPLVTTGPYAVVRHPSYSAAALTWYGLWLLLLDPSSSICQSLPTWVHPVAAVGAAIAPLALVLRIRREETMLAQEFGDEWKRYTRKTRSIWIPWVW